MTYLFAGYTVLWTVIFVYLLTLQRRIARLQREVTALRSEDTGGK